ncbi:MAG: TonB-dependent receptor plug domain-containing protein [Acidobacteriota bacterium]
MRLCLVALLALPLLAVDMRGKLDNAPFTRVLLTAPNGAILAETTTDANGEYFFQNAPADARPVPARHVTVTALRGAAVDAAESPQVVLNGGNPNPTAAHALEGQPNVLMQQTGAGQVSPFLRGLTGYQVLNLIDGVRFNNSTFRSGPNQYLAYLEPSQADHVEAMLGPTGTQYGSDGLGGTIQVLTRPTNFSDSPRWSGRLSLNSQSADLGAGAAAEAAHSTPKLFVLFGGAGHRHNDLRAGGGFDSRNVLTRLYGLPRDRVKSLLGPRLQDTAYSQAGAHGKLALRPSATQSLTGWYQRGELWGIRNYKDLWGGLGRLTNEFTPQILDLGYLRYEKLNAGPFDSLSARLSLNSQQDGGIRQNLRPTDPVTREFNRVTAYGYTGQGVTHLQSHTLLAFGAELYDERIRSVRTINNAPARPLYPNNSSYRSAGYFLQGSTELPARLRAGYGLRYTRVNYAQLTFADWTGHASLSYRLTPSLALHATGSRGFRAPNLNDLGALGLNDLGYEIPVVEALNATPLLADSAGEGALSKGTPARALGFETLRNVEAGLQFRSTRHSARVQFFDALLADPIVRRTLLFPATAVPASLAGLPVTPIPPTAAQRAQGVVTVATTFDPRAVKAFVNDGASRYWGAETLWRTDLTTRWRLLANYSYLLGRDLYPNRNIRRLPPQQGEFALRYARRWYVEAVFRASGAQNRLSGGDIDDERIGASRRRSDIADFFNGGRAPNIGETLQQIQDRVLPGLPGTTRVPLYNNTAGWATIEIRGWLPISERWSLYGGIANLTDRNYRLHGSGIDAPGCNASLGARLTF